MQHWKMSYLEKTNPVVCAVLLRVCAGFRNGKHRLSANENNENNTNDADRVRGGKLEWEQIHRKKASLPSSLVLRLHGANAQRSFTRRQLRPLRSHSLNFLLNGSGQREEENTLEKISWMKERRTHCIRPEGTDHWAHVCVCVFHAVNTHHSSGVGGTRGR